ncbi:MAG: DUF1846 domain-containing protein [bacterium]
MTRKKGFDNDKYLAEQSEAIIERVGRFNNKLYLEFGGKLIFDYHASRVLPGFDPNVKIRLLQGLKDKADLILCIYAGDIERKKMRADFGITYDSDALKLIDDLRDWDLEICAVVITRFEGRPATAQFKKKLERRGITVYTHMFTKGYPTDVDLIVSDEGYGANPFIETTKPLVVVTGPGPNSGKLATCLSQLYHEHKRGVGAGYAKFETFPIWNLPLKHPVNVAYEAATADLHDINMIDPFHLEAYDEKAVNYNRDIEAFPVVRRILDRVMDGGSCYASPTDMGVNRAGFGIVDDETVREAARQETIRRFFRYSCEYAMGYSTKETVQRAELIMKEIGTGPEDRRTVAPARAAAAESEAAGKGYMGVYCGAAIELDNGAIVAGKTSPMMHAASSVVMNAIKTLAEIPDKIHLLPPAIINSIAGLKQEIMYKKSVNLDLLETLIALSISATSNTAAQCAMEQLKRIRGCEVHMTHMPTPGDEAGFRRLGVNMTSDPQFATKSLFAG